MPWIFQAAAVFLWASLTMFSLTGRVGPYVFAFLCPSPYPAPKKRGAYAAYESPPPCRYLLVCTYTHRGVLSAVSMYSHSGLLKGGHSHSHVALDDKRTHPLSSHATTHHAPKEVSKLPGPRAGRGDAIDLRDLESDPGHRHRQRVHRDLRRRPVGAVGASSSKHPRQTHCFRLSSARDGALGDERLHSPPEPRFSGVCRL